MFPLLRKNGKHPKKLDYSKAMGGARKRFQKICTGEITDSVKVRVQKGAALLFFPVDENGDDDLLMVHGACPVLSGDKWIAQQWVHEWTFTPSLDPTLVGYWPWPRGTIGPKNTQLIEQHDPRFVKGMVMATKATGGKMKRRAKGKATKKKAVRACCDHCCVAWIWLDGREHSCASHAEASASVSDGVVGDCRGLCGGQ